MVLSIINHDSHLSSSLSLPSTNFTDPNNPLLCFLIFSLSFHTHSLSLTYTLSTMSASREVSTMIKQGFISDSTLSLSPSRPILSRILSPSSSPSKTNILPSLSPPPSFSDKVRSSPTLFEMMSEEQQRESKLNDDKKKKLHDRVSRVLSEALVRGLGFGFGDVKLTVVSRDGYRVTMDVHRKVLANRSRFFAEKLRQDNGLVSHSVEICDCDDVEVYVETVLLMYCDDLRKRLLGEDVIKVLGLLKVSAAIVFDTGISACLEYLEAVPWSEDEEEKIVTQLNQLRLQDSITDVLQRILAKPSTSTRTDDIVSRLLTGVLQAKDEKARREMKTLISRLLREDKQSNSISNDTLDVSRDTLYNLCHRCLSSLVLCLSEATGMDENRRDRGVLIGEIAREADNMQWIVDLLIDKKMGDEFVKLWADQKELSLLHSKIPTMYRYGISRITAQICIAIGRGQVLVPKDTRFLLLSTWLEALFEDFGWMKRACRSVDKKLVEDGLSQTILTLPLQKQQSILLGWFDRFLNNGDDCPNIQRAFEVWWRRAFIRPYAGEQDNTQLQMTVCDFPD